MKAHHRSSLTPRRLLGVALSLLLATLLGGLWIAQVTAQPPAHADFRPTYDAPQAIARVTAAQSITAAYRTLSRLSPPPAAPHAALDAALLPQVPTVYFSQTGHHVSNRSGFLDFWRANGQVLIFGYPITEEIIEDGRVVQYFERARFELHPEHVGTPFQVQLGRLGHELIAPEYLAGVPDPQNGARYFPTTQHALWGEFRTFWERRGSTDVFGLPLSEERSEDGRTVQWFERARFEHHPEDMAPFYRNAEAYSGLNLNTLFEVRLSSLGSDVAAARGISTAPVVQLAGVPEWSPALWGRHIEVDLSVQWLTAYEDGLLVYRAPIATGRDGFNTPPGSFAVYDKLSMQTMQGEVGDESWFVPNIPWVMYVVGGVAMHGTYWHNAFGTGARMSHGCINLSMDDAHWLYDWADIGTTVNIHY